MQIIEYQDKYLEDVKDLLVELEEYIISIDKDNLDQLHSEYRDKMATLDLEEVTKYNGKCYLAIENDKAIGLIMGIIPEYEENDYLDYKCPKRGEITELIVTNKVRSTGVGKQLMSKMEEYFKKGMMETLRGKIGGALVKPSMKKVLKGFDTSENGGAPLLGLKGLVVKTHGSSKSQEITNSILQCIAFKKQDISKKIEENLQKDKAE